MSLDPQDALSAPRNTARAIVIKSEDIFFLSEHDATVPRGNRDGFGLYFHDCRYLDGYEVLMAGTPLNALLSSCSQGAIAEFEMTNAPYKLADGRTVEQQTLGVTLKRVIDSDQTAVHDLITITNYGVHNREVPLSIQFHSSFEDVFVIRGITNKTQGKEHKPTWEHGVLTLAYEGQDGVSRRLEIDSDPTASSHSSGKLQYSFELGGGKSRQIRLSLRIREGERSDQVGTTVTDTQAVSRTIHQRTNTSVEKYAQFESDNDLLNQVMSRSLLDIGMLRSRLNDCEYISAGLPWYGALFGRDSIIAALQTLPLEPSIAEQTIRLLAKHQGSETDHWRDEEPGKILHELRRGELANLNEIPQTPYYGAVDSTPLFLILVAEHARWTGSTGLFEEIRSHVEEAMQWIDHYADLAGNGYVSYDSKSSKGLGNQGWKDSGDAIVNADGSLATPPISLVEVQGYTYLAKTLIAQLYLRTGDEQTASRLQKKAADLKKRFNHDYWIDEKQFLALALQKENRPAAVISSNPGQALWTGIVDDAKAKAVVQGLMSKDMFSGWGVRTLSMQEKRANPVAYHLGTVWPHDNSIIAAGMRRYGFDGEALSVCAGILNAARHFEHHRLPEVFAGFSQEQFSTPVRYPVACHPQAWAAGSVPFMVTSLLGLEPEAFEKRLRVIRPVLPKGTTRLQLRRVKIGQGTIDLDFRRSRDSVEVKVIGSTGNVLLHLGLYPNTSAA